MARVLAFILLTAVAACSGDATSSADRPSTAPSPRAAPSAPPPPTLSPPDAGLHYLTCDHEIEIECPDGYEPGCGGWTDYIVCVRKEVPAQVSCGSEIVVRCRDGEVNSCAMTPPMGDVHVCVLVDRRKVAP